ncbi:MAG: carboxypeptidase regulatory-like domain-containing protein [Blastocatellia bacterium]|nr:carboxypeptidase regulatory-like domain-containing protein [Blastocatellia bacterium]
MKHQLKYAMVILLFLFVQAGAQTGTIKGKVKGQKDKALEGVVVRAIKTAGQERIPETKSDSNGDFELTGLQPGSYSLTFEKPGYKRFSTHKLDLAAGDTLKLNRVIELSRESESFAVIRGAVFNPGGFTLSNAAVTIERIDGGKKFKKETVSLEGGEFAFRVKAEKAKYRISATYPGYQTSATEVEIESDEVRNIAVRLQKE